MFPRPLRAWLLAAAVLVAAAERSYYEILEVGKDAPAADIRKAYRRLALRWHPDKSREPDSAERFREVAEAYEVLGDPERRRQYDARGGDPGLHFDFDFDFSDARDVFRKFFGDEDPFAGVEQMFSDIRRELDQHLSGVEKVQASGAAEHGGLFSAFSSFVSSFTSSFSSSSSSGGDVKISQRTVETNIESDGHRVTKTVENDGSTMKVTVEETSTATVPESKAAVYQEPANDEEVDPVAAAAAEGSDASAAAESRTDDAGAGGSADPDEAADVELSPSEEVEEPSLASTASEPAESTAPPSDGGDSEATGSAASMEAEETPDNNALGAAVEVEPSAGAAKPAAFEPVAGTVEEARGAGPSPGSPPLEASVGHSSQGVPVEPPAEAHTAEEAAALPAQAPPVMPSAQPTAQELGGLADPTILGAALGHGPTPVGRYPSPFSGGAGALGTARWTSSALGTPAALLGPGDSRGAPASTVGLETVPLGRGSAEAVGSPGSQHYGSGGAAALASAADGTGLPRGSSPFARADSAGVAGPDAALGGGAAAGVSRCDSLPFVQDAEPVDTTVRHVPGSACCNVAPQPAATNRYGCCQRCLNNPNCEVYVWQPSTGTCWLLQWKGPLRTTVLAPDRVMGDRAGAAVP